MLLGLVIGLMRVSASRFWREVSSFYVEILRGVPMLVILYYIAFVGAPLSQTIYGMILGNAIRAANLPPSAYPATMLMGLLAGLAIGMSAWMQGKAGAKAADALAETGQGFGNYLMVVGVIETVALFTMVFSLTALPSAP